MMIGKNLHSAGRSYLAFSFLSCLVDQAVAHSWLEQLQAISKNGTFIGSMGYTRGYMARTDTGYNGDSMDYLIPALETDRMHINSSDLLCHPSQRTSNYSSAYPMLQVSPGGYVAMKYLENGHVTQPDIPSGKPKAGGTIFVYGTTAPKIDEKIVDVLKWTEDGKGGDGRGKLLTAQNFDDGRCHQLNTSPLSEQRQKEFPDHVPGQPTSNLEQWCETDLEVPHSSTAGEKLTVYWLWQWPTLPGAEQMYPDGKDEYYSTCLDLDIVAEANSTVGDTAQAKYALTQQDPQTAACSDFASRTAYTTSPSTKLAQGASYSTSMPTAVGNNNVATSPAASSSSSPLSQTSRSLYTLTVTLGTEQPATATTTETTLVTATTLVTMTQSVDPAAAMSSSAAPFVHGAKPTVGSNGIVGEKRFFQPSTVIEPVKRSAKFNRI